MKVALGIFICLSVVVFSQEKDSLFSKNEKIVDYVIKHGKEISPTYRSAVCTELVIGVLKQFTKLDEEDKSRVRIIIHEDLNKLRGEKSPITKGVYYALTSKGKGIAIDSLKDVLPGDFVQFWYESWGHCGIVSSVAADHKTMLLHSSYPSTDGYGIQEFEIPQECYFVRLK